MKISKLKQNTIYVEQFFAFFPIIKYQKNELIFLWLQNVKRETVLKDNNVETFYEKSDPRVGLIYLSQKKIDFNKKVLFKKFILY